MEPIANNPLPLLIDGPELLVILAFFILWGGCWLPLGVFSARALKWKPGETLKPEQKLPLLLSLYLLAPLVLWVISKLVNKSFSDYGLEWNISLFQSLGLGFVLGVLTLGLIFLGEFCFGWCRFQKSKVVMEQGITSLLPIIPIALLVAAVEELIFRGFLFAQLLQDFSPTAAAIVSSLIFALLHLVWERQETLPQIPGLWFMGMVLVWSKFVDSGSLGLAWGLHSGWVWAMATIDTSEIITYTGNISEWMTGKNKKPLAGIAGFACLLLTCAALLIVRS